MPAARGMTEEQMRAFEAQIAEGVVDFGGISTTMPRVGEGFYPFEVTECKVSKGQDTGNLYYAWRFTITEGDMAGRLLFFNSGLTAKSAWSTKRTLIALGYEESELVGPLPIAEIAENVIGAQGVAVVGTNMYRGEERDRVTRIMPAGSLEEDLS